MNNTSSCCHSTVVLTPKQQTIVLYENSNFNDTLGFLINDTISENYFIATILKIKKGFAFVKGSYVLSDTVKCSGWVETKYLGIYLIADDKIPLYTRPNFSSEKSYINNPEWYPLEIIKCNNGWLYVKYKDKHQEKQGWLPAEYQCPNPYTICN